MPIDNYLQIRRIGKYNLLPGNFQIPKSQQLSNSPSNSPYGSSPGVVPNFSSELPKPISLANNLNIQSLHLLAVKLAIEIAKKKNVLRNTAMLLTIYIAIEQFNKAAGAAAQPISKSNGEVEQVSPRSLQEQKTESEMFFAGHQKTLGELANKNNYKLQDAAIPSDINDNDIRRLINAGSYKKEAEFFISLTQQLRSSDERIRDNIDFVLKSRDLKIVFVPQQEIQAILNLRSPVICAYVEKTHTIYVSSLKPTLIYSEQALAKVVRHEFWHAYNAILHSKNFYPPANIGKKITQPFYPPNHDEMKKFKNALEAGDNLVFEFDDLLKKERLGSDKLKLAQKKELAKYKSAIDKGFVPSPVVTEISIEQYNKLKKTYQVNSELSTIYEGIKGLKTIKTKIISLQMGAKSVQIYSVPVDNYSAFIMQVETRGNYIKAVYGESVAEDRALTEADAIIEEFPEQILEKFYGRRRRYHERTKLQCLAENSPEGADRIHTPEEGNQAEWENQAKSSPGM